MADADIPNLCLICGWPCQTVAIINDGVRVWNHVDETDRSPRDPGFHMAKVAPNLEEVNSVELAKLLYELGEAFTTIDHIRARMRSVVPGAKF